jgi:hypothetical protein
MPNPTTTDGVNELDFCEFTPTGDCADCNVTSTERISACPARPATGDAAAEVVENLLVCPVCEESGASLERAPSPEADGREWWRCTVCEATFTVDPR